MSHLNKFSPNEVQLSFEVQLVTVYYKDDLLIYYNL